MTTHLFSHQDTVYGRRNAVISGLAIIHRGPSIFKATAGWKHSVIREVHMLPRAGMYKPEVTWNEIAAYFLYPCGILQLAEKTIRILVSTSHMGGSHMRMLCVYMFQSLLAKSRHAALPHTWGEHSLMHKNCVRHVWVLNLSLTAGLN